MEFLDEQRVFVALSLFLLTTHFPEFEGHQYETTSHAPLKDCSTGFGDFLDETDEMMLVKEIEIELQTSRAKNFLDGLSNPFKRRIVTTNLRLCPFVRLCQFELKLNPLTYDLFGYNSCCFPCSCDKENCLSSGTCCPDILRSGNNTPDLSNDIPETCVATELKDIYTNVDGVKANSGCPRETDSDLVAKCERIYEYSLRDIEIEDITLVSDASSDQIYRNKYCAECNYMNTSSLLYWSPRVQCSHLLEMSLITSSMDLIKQIVYGEVSCNVIFQQPKIRASIESCTHSISVCNFTGLWKSYDPDLDKACGLYESVVLAKNGQYFRNVFCAYCNGFYPTLTDKCGEVHFTVPTPVDYAGFLRLSDTIQDDSDSCGKDEKYDSIKEKCRPTVCSGGREMKNGRCELILDGLVTMDLDINLRLDPQDPIPLHSAYDIVPIVKHFVVDEIYNRVDVQTLCSVQVLLQSNLLSTKTTNRNPLSDQRGEVAGQRNASELIFYLLRIQISVQGYFEKTVESLKSLNGTLAIPKVTGDLVFVMKLVQDTHKRKFDKILSLMNSTFKDKNVENGDNDINYAVSLSNSLSLFEDDDNMLQIPYLWTDWSSDYCKHEPRYALLSLKSCVMFKIPWEEFDWKQKTDGIEMEGPSIRLDVEDYKIVTKSQSRYLLICVDTYLEKFKPLARSVKDVDFDPVKIAKIVISLICVCASIICLVFSLVTYFMLKQLRTLPGKNNIALIVSLIFAQVCYLVGGTANFDRNSVICKTVGLLTHFFWLVSMFWMNTCTFHMCKVLLETRNVSHHGNCRRYLYYHLYCISMTLICVVINVGVSMATSENTDIGYGKIICYVSTQRMVDFTFGVPSMLVVVSNFGMFLAVIISLKRRPSIRQNVKNDINYFVIFIKLSTVTGITWIFGFLYMWTGLEAFSFLFIILNASQGLFIMLAFVCNKRTITLYKELLRTRDRSSPPTGVRSAGTSSTSL